jgi:heme-degrading monooxygenase HmoA
MISRIWHGWTTVENADAYERIVSTEVLPGIAARQIPGFRGAHLLRRPLGDEVEFATIIWFDSIDNVRDFMGEDYAVAHVPPRAQAVLARYEERAEHAWHKNQRIRWLVVTPPDVLWTGPPSTDRVPTRLSDQAIRGVKAVLSSPPRGSRIPGCPWSG